MRCLHFVSTKEEKSTLLSIYLHPFPLCDAEMISLWSANSLLLHHLHLSHVARNTRKGFCPKNHLKRIFLFFWNWQCNQPFLYFTIVRDIFPLDQIQIIWNQMVFEFRQPQSGKLLIHALCVVRCVLCAHEVWLAFAGWGGLASLANMISRTAIWNPQQYVSICWWRGLKTWTKLILTAGSCVLTDIDVVGSGGLINRKSEG